MTVRQQNRQISLRSKKNQQSIVSCDSRLQWKSTLNKVNVSSMKVSEYKGNPAGPRLPDMSCDASHAAIRIQPPRSSHAPIALQLLTGENSADQPFAS